MIRNLADEAEFDLKRLTVELTETALVDDLNLAGVVAADLKRMGIRLSLDDFGTATQPAAPARRFHSTS